MGMAASQARLLTLTARLHDVEYSAQQIENAKLQLADQEDAVYEEYLNALDATVLTGTVYNTSTATSTTVAATFNNLCGSNSTIQNESGTVAYGLVNTKTGKLYVTQEMYDAYNEYNGSDSDEFALLQLGYTQAEATAYLKYKESGICYQLVNPTGEEAASLGLKVVTSGDEYDSSCTYYTKDENGSNGYTKVTNLSSTYCSTNSDGELEFNSDAYSGDLYVAVSFGDADYNSASAYIADVSSMASDLKENGQYYKNTYELIQCLGGCEVLNSKYLNDSDWLTSMVDNCAITIYTLQEDISSDTGYIAEATSTSTSEVLSDTTESTLDSTALARAEAEYNRALKKIDKKDTQYDTELEELETERASITTELESLRTVIDDNIDRTFGVFS